MAAEYPISIWPTAQNSPARQRAGRYLPVSGTHPAKMLPAIAAHAIATYTNPGDLVLDPMCGIGTTLVEAVHLGRDAIGVEYEPRWAALAEANLAHARSRGATGRGEVVCGDARHLRALADPAVRGLVALVLTSPPYGATLHGQVRTQPGGGVHKSHYRYSTDPANLAHQPTTALLDGLARILAEAASLLRLGGIVALTVRPFWTAGQLVDLPGEVGRLAERAGLVLFERNVAILTGLRDDHLVPRPSFFALDQARRARRRGLPRMVVAHEDLVVMRKPETSTSRRSSQATHARRSPK
jgi:modification methylase